VPAIVLTLLQGLVLLLLYLFVAQAVRSVTTDVAVAGTDKDPVGRANADDAPGAKRLPPEQLVIHVAGNRPRVLNLGGESLTLGRSTGAGIPLDDSYVSDEHARLARTDGDRWTVTDLASTNGTYVNQRRITAPTTISAGDQIAIGRTIVEVRR